MKDSWNEYNVVKVHTFSFSSRVFTFILGESPLNYSPMYIHSHPNSRGPKSNWTNEHNLKSSHHIRHFVANPLHSVCAWSLWPIDIPRCWAPSLLTLPPGVGVHLHSVWSSASETRARLNRGQVSDLAGREHSNFGPIKLLGRFGSRVLNHRLAARWKVVRSYSPGCQRIRFSRILQHSSCDIITTQGSHTCPSYSTQTAVRLRWGGGLWSLDRSF